MQEQISTSVRRLKQHSANKEAKQGNKDTGKKCCPEARDRKAAD